MLRGLSSIQLPSTCRGSSPLGLKQSQITQVLQVRTQRGGWECLHQIGKSALAIAQQKKFALPVVQAVALFADLRLT
jgi:hypothetical protein